MICIAIIRPPGRWHVTLATSLGQLVHKDFEYIALYFNLYWKENEHMYSLFNRQTELILRQNANYGMHMTKTHDDVIKWKHLPRY